MTKLLYITYITLAVVMGSENFSHQNEQEILTKEEEEDLVMLREEEKLARDVYLYSYNKYGLKIFNNISGSEERHMSQVLQLLNKYGIPDPVIPEKGVFKSKKMQDLYNQLTAQSDISLIEALKVGATIEDLDIFDIEELEKRTSNPIILNVYSKLKCGSRNHMRAFTKQLKKNGGYYQPQYITESLYKSIIKGSNEKCGQQGKKMQGMGKHKGKGHGNGMGRGQRQGKRRGMMQNTGW